MGHKCYKWQKLQIQDSHEVYPKGQIDLDKIMPKNPNKLKPKIVFTKPLKCKN